MFLSMQQKFILDTLKKLNCVRRRQLHTLVRGQFQQDGFEITQTRMDTMLRQLRVGTADVRLDDGLVWLSNAQPDARRLEAIDVMLELTGGRPREFSTSREPPRLLRFAYGDDLRPFTVASLNAAPAELLERSKAERIVWIADSGTPPQGLALPPKHFSPPANRTAPIASMAPTGHEDISHHKEDFIMPRKKINTEEEIRQGAEMAEQPGMEAAPPEKPPQDTGVPDGSPPPLPGEPGEAMSGAVPGLTGDGEGEAEEVMAVDATGFPPDDGLEGELPEPMPEGEPSMDGQEPGPTGDVSMEGAPPADEAPPAGEKDAPPPEPPDGDAPPAPPLTDRQSFFALDFHELDRGLSQEERQAWNSIYASFRGHSTLSGRVIGADPLSMNVRSKETGQVERRTMYCVVVLVYRVPVYIPATEMWMGEARPDYVLQNMMGSTIDFIITKVDREGGYAIASRRQAARAQRYFFAHRPDLCAEGARVKCRLLAVGPRRCLAECYGHDIDLTQRELSYTAIADLRTQYRPGDELDCIVKGYDAPRRELLISVKETESNPFEGAEQRHPVGSRRYAVIAGKYGGGVFCNLPDGTVCMCNYSYQHEDSEFQSGDHVTLVVQRFERDKRQMYGKIMSKR